MKFKGLDIDPRKLDESVTVKPRIITESATAFKEAQTEGGMRYLLPRIEAIHAGTTRNSTRYPAEKLRGHAELESGVFSWMKPYPKPVIYNHDVETEATGRIQTAAFSEFTTAGRPGIIVVPKITSEKAIDDILGGRLLTVSIGATTDAATCTVCGTNIIEEGFCGHYKGEEYDGIKAEWIVGNVWFDELSWVNVPADQDAMIISQGLEISTAEAFATNGREVINLGKTTTEWLVDPQVVISEGLTVTAEAKKGDTTLTEEQIKALQDELKAAKEAKEAADTELAKAVTEKEAAEAALAIAQGTLADKETELTSTQESLSTKEAELANLVTEKTGLEASLEEEKNARTQAVAENATLASEVHKSIVERVVDLRIQLGKEANREEAVTEFVGRSKESLSDSLADLLKEATVAAVKPPARQAELLPNPASNDADPVPATKEGLSTEDVLANLFRGPAFNKK